MPHLDWRKNILPFQGRIAGKCLTEHSLAHAAAVDIRVIKEICALLQSGVDKMIHLVLDFRKTACIRPAMEGNVFVR